MILRVLLLIRFTCCVCGTFVVNVTQSFYQAEENHNITLEWSFTTTDDTSPKNIFIFCEMRTDQRAKPLFHLRGGEEIPQSQDKQFAGRVQCDKDVLREGRVRLHVSRLRIEDSGLYLCEVMTSSGLDEDKCRLNVTAARDQPEPERPNTTRDQPEPERPNSVNRGRIAPYWSLGVTAAVLLVCGLLIFHLLCKKKYPHSESNGGSEQSSSSADVQRCEMLISWHEDRKCSRLIGSGLLQLTRQNEMEEKGQLLAKQQKESQRLLCSDLCRQISPPQHPGLSFAPDMWTVFQPTERRTRTGRGEADSVFSISDVWCSNQLELMDVVVVLHVLVDPQ